MASREDVLNALSQVARRFRTRMGESLATVEKHSTPLAEATTPSLDALKAYSTGNKVAVSSGNAAAIPFSGALSKSIPNSRWRMPIWGCRIGCCRVSAISREHNKSLAIAGSRQRSGKVLYRLYLRPAGDGQSGKGVPNPRVVASDVSSRQSEIQSPQDLLGGLSTHGTGRFERAIEASQKTIADDPDFTIRVWQSCIQLFLRGPFPRSRAYDSTSHRTQAGGSCFPDGPIQHRGLKG